MPSRKPTYRRKDPPTALLVAIAGGLLLIITAIWMLTNGSATSATPTITPNLQSEIPYPEVARVSLIDAKAALEAGSAVFVDVRDAEVYAMSHIPGALSIPEVQLQSRVSELDPGQWIITYCT